MPIIEETPYDYEWPKVKRIEAGHEFNDLSIWVEYHDGKRWHEKWVNVQLTEFLDKELTERFGAHHAVNVVEVKMTKLAGVSYCASIFVENYDGAKAMFKIPLDSYRLDCLIEKFTND